MNPYKSLAQAKENLEMHANKGINCELCGQYYKIYKRPITSSMATALILLYKFDQENPDEWVHLSNYIKDNHPEMPIGVVTGDNPKLRYWGLIELKIDLRKDGSDRNGFLKITEKGRAYARGELEVADYMIVCNKKVIGRSDETSNINSALGKKFSYRELMD